MTILIEETDTNDNSVLYYTFYLYYKIQSLLKYINKDNNKFEANEIIDGLYLGCIDSSFDYNTLKDKGITHIISVIAGFEPPYPNDFNYLVINALDTVNTELFNNFYTAIKFIDDALDNNGKVLVHCIAGRSRSAAIVCAYIIHTFGMDVGNVIKYTKSRREIVDPNESFKIQLDDFYKIKYQTILIEDDDKDDNDFIII